MKKNHIITASRTLDGQPVYWTAAKTWSESDTAARIFANKDEAQSEIEGARKTEHLACDPYLIPVTVESGAVSPLRLKEQIRAAGPQAVLDAMGYGNTEPVWRQ